MEASSGAREGLLSLPQGGGGLRSMGERFQPDLFRGTGNYSIPVGAPAGPGGLRPSISLVYSTGQGNGPFGLGWRLGGPLDVRRRTDRGLPTYQDEQDEFALGAADVLVPVGGDRFRPRSDTRFWDIRRSGDGWAIRTKEGHGYLLGTSAASRVYGGTRTFAWHLETETDAAGNRVSYRYERDGGVLYLTSVDWSIYSLRLIYDERPDVLLDARAGFPLTTARRCVAIERCCERLAQPLLTRYRLEYTQAEGSGLSLLTTVQVVGFDDDAATQAYPPIRLSYSGHRPDVVRYLDVGNESTAPPPPLGDPGVTLVDMTGDGLPDVLSTGPMSHVYWRNLGAGAFGPPRPLRLLPAGMVVGRKGVSFADLNGDGAADIFRADTRLGLAVLNTATGAWAPRPLVYRQQPSLPISHRSTQLVDLDGDGVVDLLQSAPGSLLATFNRGAAGWTRPQSLLRTADPDRFPYLDLSSPQTHLADMNGDGLSDIVFVGPGQVEYWPSLGFGQWGTRIRMLRAPKLPHRYQPERVFLTDIDGDGTADIVYVDYDRVLYWLNRSGHGWSQTYEIPFVPPPFLPTVHMVDLLGTGTRGVLWSHPSRLGRQGGYHFLDLAGGNKPYLLTRIDNGLGGITTIDYTTSTAARAADEAEHRPWHSYLPFPMQLVSEIIEHDLATQQVRHTRIRYHRGYYDGTEREFRGFESVEVYTPGDAHSPTVVAQTDFYLGALANPVQAADRPVRVRMLERALAGSPVATRCYEVLPNGNRRLSSSAELTWCTLRTWSGPRRATTHPASPTASTSPAMSTMPLATSAASTGPAALPTSPGTPGSSPTSASPTPATRPPGWSACRPVSRCATARAASLATPKTSTTAPRSRGCPPVRRPEGCCDAPGSWCWPTGRCHPATPTR
jgi:hypothetical protein